MQRFSPDRATSLVGRAVEHYRIQSHLGSGGMGHVFRAQDEHLNRKVAVKVLRHALAGDETARRRFLREASISPRVVHPYVATVFDVVEWEGELVLVMEYIEGRPLDVYVRDERPDTAEVARLGLEISEALAEIHRHGLVHRDLKPGNVMVTPTGHVKVLDFGLVGLAPEATSDGSQEETEESLTGKSIVGTPLYMSPEQLRRQEVDGRSDLFSLGSLLYQSITGRHPFRRDTYIDSATAILQENPGPGEEPESLSQSGPLRSVVLRLLEKERTDRYQSARDVVQDFQALLSGEVMPSGEIQKAVRRKRRTRLTVWAAVAVAAVAALALGLPPLLRAIRPPDVRPVVTVLPFTDRAGPSADAVRGEMVASLVAAGVSRSDGLRSVGHDRVLDLLWSRPAEASLDERIRAVRQGVRTRWIVAGTLFSGTDSLRAVVDVYGPDDERPVHSFDVASAGAVGIANRVVSRLLAAPALVGAAAVEGEGDDVPPDGNDEAELLHYEARQAMREYRFSAAIDLLERSLALDPDSARAQIDLAAALGRSGYETRAREAAARARRLTEGPGARVPPEVRWDALAVEAGILDDITTRIDVRRTMAEARPDDPTALANLSDALLRGGRSDEALAAVDQALSLDDRAPRLHLLKARVLLARNRPDDVEDELAEAERLYDAAGTVPGLAWVAHLRGTVRLGQGDHGGAMAEYERAATIYRDAGLPVLSKISEAGTGDVHLFTGQLAMAESIYRSSLSEARAAGNSTLYVRSLSALGVALYESGSMDDAETYLKEAIVEARRLESDRLLVEPLANLASVVAYVGRTGEGSALAEEAVPLAVRLGDDDSAAVARTTLADSSYRLGNLARAAEAYGDLVRQLEAPGGEPVYLAWSLTGQAEVLQASGDLGGAVAAADRAVAVAETVGQPMLEGYARVQRASVYGEVARFDDAIADLDAALVGATEDPDLVDQVTRVRGAVAARRGDLDRALELLLEARRKAAASETRDVEAESLVFASLAAVSKGDPREAARLARAALELDRVADPLRVRARSCLALALAEADLAGEAGKEGRLALEEGESLGMPLATVRAAAALVALPAEAGIPDREGIRDRGSRALKRYLESVPAADRAAVEKRTDLSVLIDRLGSGGP
jgi:tetratricopeptide (TPR) repeat protein